MDGHGAAGPDGASRTVASLAAVLEVLEDRFGIDVDATQHRAAEIERAAAELGEPALRLRARLLWANMRRRSGDIATAAQVSWEVHAWASEHGHRPLLARGHQLLSAIYDNLGDTAAGLEHAVRAVAYLDDDTPARARAVILMKLGDDLALGGSGDAARDRYRQAEQVAIASRDTELQMVILNNLAYADCLGGEPERGWATIERLGAVAAATGQRLNADALDTVARVQLALGRYLEAEQTAQATLREHEAAGREDSDALAEYLLTLAVAQRTLGDTAAARASLDRAAALAAARDLAGVRVRVLEEQAELYAAQGEAARAYAVYKEFHLADRQLVSQQRETQARARQAMLEVAEARKEADRFREQARRDPLTGLFNRRYVDERLPALLEAGTPLVAAIVHLDHFTRVNDTCSHDTGDRVLVAVADLLGAVVPPGTVDGGGFAARLDGEESLLVLTRTGPAQAMGRLDELRRAVAGYPWQPLTGDLRVTVSIGVTCARPGAAPGDLLARADESLSAAKRAGRNRVRLDPEVRTR
jgi:diguanylate cyclase (GGDEF)-like protein